MVALVAAGGGVSGAAVDGRPDARVFVVGVGGKGLRALTGGGGVGDYAPAVAPGGGRVAFVRGEGAFAPNVAPSDIWVVAVANRRLVRLTDTPEQEFDPQWSPDGKRISYSVYAPCGYRCGDWWTVIRRSDGTGTPSVIPASRHLRWSRSGEIAYESEVDAVVGDAGGIDVGRAGHTGPVALDGRYRYSDPVLAPPARWVAYYEDRGDRPLLRVAALPGRTRRTLDMRASGDVAWSPDGKRLAYVRGAAVYRVGVDGRARHRLAPAAAAAPAWAPRGNRIAFAGRGGIFVVRADGRGLRRVARTGTPTPSTPAWSPDGKRVYFSGV